MILSTQQTYQPGLLGKLPGLGVPRDRAERGSEVPGGLEMPLALPTSDRWAGPGRGHMGTWARGHGTVHLPAAPPPSVFSSPGPWIARQSPQKDGHRSSRSVVGKAYPAAT